MYPLILLLSVGAEPNYDYDAAAALALATKSVTSKVEPKQDFTLRCFNCSSCGNSCSCYGRTYNCANGKCQAEKEKGITPVPTTPSPTLPKKVIRDRLIHGGVTYEKCDDGIYRPISNNGVQGVTPSATFPKSGGCGCEASRNCGASFCKARGGTGCPTSCPVKK